MNKWRAFAAIALSFVTIVFAMSMSFLVLPSIADEFDITLRAVGWVVIIDALIVSALLLPLGALGDTLGRKRVLLAGMAIFAIGTVLVGLAPTFGLVLVARVVMAFGNALVQSIATGLLVAAFPPEERGLAIGAQSTAVACGSATGPLVVGLALDAVGWRNVFMLMAIPAALSALCIYALIDTDTPSRAHAGFDRVGALLGALLITVMVVTINDPLDLGWQSPAILLGVVGIVVLAITFVRWELGQTKPMLELRLFSIPVFRLASTVRVVAFIAATIVSLLLPIYLLTSRELSSGRAGLFLSCMAIGMGISSQVSGRMYDLVGPRLPTLIGLTTQTVVHLLLAFADESTSLGVLVVVAFTNGLASGLWNVPNNSAMMGATPPQDYGVGGAFTNVTRTVGNVLGQALAAAVVVAVMASQGFDIPLGDIGETAGAGAAFLDGWRVAFIIGAAVTSSMLLPAMRLPHTGKVPAWEQSTT